MRDTWDRPELVVLMRRTQDEILTPSSCFASASTAQNDNGPNDCRQVDAKCFHTTQPDKPAT